MQLTSFIGSDVTDLVSTRNQISPNIFHIVLLQVVLE
jgi:hypothetical protein